MHSDSTSLMKSPNIAASLVPELLSRIATIAISTNPTSYTRELIRLSQVCRHWRHTLSSNPSLWTKIVYPGLNLSLMNMVLSRSANYSLEVTVNFQKLSDLKKPLKKILDLIFTHIHRIETLNLTGLMWHRQHSVLDYVYSLLDKTGREDYKMVRFRQFHIVEYTQDLDPKLARLPESFLHKVAPKLKELQISSVSFSYQATPIFKSMTYLSLTCVRDITSVARLLDILETASSSLIVLQLLELDGLSSESNSNELGNRLIRLSSLRALTLKLGASPLMLMLDHIELPPNMNWDIHCTDAIYDLELDIAPLVRLLKQSGPSGTFVDFDLYSAPDPAEHLEDYPAVIRMDFKTSLTARSNASLTTYLHSDKDYGDRLERLFVNLNFSKMLCCKVHISGMSPHEFANIVGFLYSFLTGLQELSLVAGDNPEDSPEDLLSFIEELRPVQMSLLCPQLKKLTVNTVVMDDRNWIEVLKKRKEAGNILTNIELIAEEFQDFSFQSELEPLAENVLIRARESGDRWSD